MVVNGSVVLFFWPLAAVATKAKAKVSTRMKTQSKRESEYHHHHLEKDSIGTQDKWKPKSIEASSRCKILYFVL
jgi:hypothetical protein